MGKFPPGCSFDRSRLFVEGGNLRREFYDMEGNVIHEVRLRGYDKTGIEVSPTQDLTTYNRTYYRRVRRFREGRGSRGFYKQ